MPLNSSFKCKSFLFKPARSKDDELVCCHVTRMGNGLIVHMKLDTVMNW